MTEGRQTAWPCPKDGTPVGLRTRGVRGPFACGLVPTCPPGSTPDTPGPAGQARPPSSPWASAFDRRAGRVVLVAPITPDDGPGVATWTFDVCTNTWTRMHPNREPPTLWARLVYDVDSDVTLLVSSRSVWAYDLRPPCPVGQTRGRSPQRVLVCPYVAQSRRLDGARALD